MKKLIVSVVSVAFLTAGYAFAQGSVTDTLNKTAAKTQTTQPIAFRISPLLFSVSL